METAQDPSDPGNTGKLTGLFADVDDAAVGTPRDDEQFPAVIIDQGAVIEKGVILQLAALLAGLLYLA